MDTYYHLATPVVIPFADFKEAIRHYDQSLLVGFTDTEHDKRAFIQSVTDKYNEAYVRHYSCYTQYRYCYFVYDFTQDTVAIRSWFIHEEQLRDKDSFIYYLFSRVPTTTAWVHQRSGTFALLEPSDQALHWTYPENKDTHGLILAKSTLVIPVHKSYEVVNRFDVPSHPYLWRMPLHVDRCEEDVATIIIGNVFMRFKTEPNQYDTKLTHLSTYGPSRAMVEALFTEVFPRIVEQDAEVTLYSSADREYVDYTIQSPQSILKDYVVRFNQESNYGKVRRIIVDRKRGWR